MKKYLLPLALLPALLVSCNKEPEYEISVSPSELTVGAEGGVYEVTVTSSHDWYAYSGNRRIYLSTQNGNGGETVVTITVQGNSSREESISTCRFYITSHASCQEEVFLTVRQLPDDSPIIQFSDRKFLEAILYDNDVDRNGDGQISEYEALMYNGELTANEEGISSMDGIQYFKALTELKCYANQLTFLDVSSNTALTRVWCNNNQLTSLSLGHNATLTELECGRNQLTSLDVRNNTALESLWCSSNQLTSLNLLHNTALKELNCAYNQITELDLRNNTALESLTCSNNPLTKIILSRYHMIDELDIQAIIGSYGDIIEYVD